jgi:hypothetical protein
MVCWRGFLGRWIRLLLRAKKAQAQRYEIGGLGCDKDFKV